MKIEKTCRCINSTRLFNGETGYDMEFHKGREYQLDVYTTSDQPEHFKVYQNGGWDHWIMMSKEEFDKIFVEID